MVSSFGSNTEIVYGRLVFAAGDCESAAVIVRSYAPACVGMPEIAPLLASVSPGGSASPPFAAQLQLYGALPPDAVN